MSIRNFPYGTTGKTLYGVLINSSGQFWYPTGSAFESYNSAHWSNYAIALVESGAGDYVLTLPAGAIATPDALTIDYRLQAGGSAVTTDIPAGNDLYAPGTPGYVQLDFTQALPTNPVANTVGEALFIADIFGGRVGVAQAGSTSTTLKLDAGASADTGAYIGDDLYLYGGTGGGVRGTGQRRTVVSYDPSTKIATVHRAWDTTPDNTTKFITLPTAKSDAWIWNGTAIPTPATPGVPDVNAKAVNNVLATSVATIAANLGTTQPINFAGTGGSARAQAALNATDVTGNLPADLQTIKTQTITCAAPVTIAAFVGATHALAVDSSGFVTLTTAEHTAISAAVMSDVSDTVGADVVAILGKVNPLPATFPGNFGSLAITAGGLVSMNLSQTGYVPRALDSIADASLTTGDLLVAAACAGAGKETVSGLSFTVATPSTGFVIRTFSLDSATAPTRRS
jgi:hypothetical protein